jgi:hypothetical protein
MPDSVYRLRCTKRNHIVPQTHFKRRETRFYSGQRGCQTGQQQLCEQSKKFCSTTSENTAYSVAFFFSRESIFFVAASVAKGENLSLLPDYNNKFTAFASIPDNEGENFKYEKHADDTDFVKIIARSENKKI